MSAEPPDAAFSADVPDGILFEKLASNSVGADSAAETDVAYI